MIHNDVQAKFKHAVEKILQDELLEVENRVMEQALLDITKRVKEMVAKVSISLVDYYAIERVGNELLIRVKIDNSQRDRI